MIRVLSKTAVPPSLHVTLNAEVHDRGHVPEQAQGSAQSLPPPAPELLSTHAQRGSGERIAQGARSTRTSQKDGNWEAPPAFPAPSNRSINESSGPTRYPLPSEGEAHRTFVMDAALPDVHRRDPGRVTERGSAHQHPSVSTPPQEPSVRRPEKDSIKRGGQKQPGKDVPSTERFTLIISSCLGIHQF